MRRVDVLSVGQREAVFDLKHTFCGETRNEDFKTNF